MKLIYVQRKQFLSPPSKNHQVPQVWEGRRVDHTAFLYSSIANKQDHQTKQLKKKKKKKEVK